MSDNPFDDLATGETSAASEADDGGEPDDENESNEEREGPAVVESRVAESVSADRSTREAQSESTSSSPSGADGTGLSGPAFEYAEVRQRPLYARGSTWDAFEDAVGITIVPELRKAGIRDEEIRELHDAALRLAIEEPERVADLLIDSRRRS